MLANVFAAVEMAANSTVPATAPADFQAGVFMGYYEQDVHDNITKCFGEDQKAADLIDQMIADVKAKDWKDIQTVAKSLAAEIKPHSDNCSSTDPLVKSMYDNEEATAKAAEADPKLKSKIISIALLHKKAIMSGNEAAIQKLTAGDYYGAGIEYGKIEKIVAKPWSTPLPGAEFLN